MLHGEKHYSVFNKRNDSRVTRSSSTNAVRISSARTMKRLPSPRSASATKIAQAVGIISALGS